MRVAVSLGSSYSLDNFFSIFVKLHIFLKISLESFQNFFGSPNKIAVTV